MLGIKSGSQRSVMSHSFSRVPNAEIERSTFDRSHGYKTTLDAGYLYPVLVDEALPGDTFALKVYAFARLNTLIFPIMDNLHLDVHFFSVPYRLLWTNWKRFNGEQDNPDDSTDFTVPKMTSPVGGYGESSIYDYMGIPPGVAGLEHMSLPLRAYNLIWNQWYRDETKQDSVTVNVGDTDDPDTDYTLLKRGKRFDYFTSCLPYPQKGDSVSLPLGTTAPVVGTASATGWNQGTDNFALYMTSGSANATWSGVPTASGEAHIGLPSGLEADLTTATAATINSLRQAVAIQRLLERDARGGTRYIEVIKAHFGVTSPDARQQRPEYLGGSSSPVMVSPVPQTGESGTTPQGNLAAMGTVTVSGAGFTHSFTEHCLVIGLVSIRADLTYQQGLARMWKRSTRYDFYWPALAHLGEQAVLRGEIYADGTANDDIVFGYQERYAELRYKNSQITGKLRSSASGSLDAWHLSQDFASAPVLDATFIEETPPIARVVAVDTEPAFIFDSYFSMHCARPMPVYGVPGMMDRF
jgi:hypothetical protein